MEERGAERGAVTGVLAQYFIDEDNIYASAVRWLRAFLKLVGREREGNR